MFENSNPSEQVGVVSSDGADRHFHLICEGSNTAESGALSPQVAMRFAKGFVDVFLKIRTHQSKSAWSGPMGPTAIFNCFVRGVAPPNTVL